MFTPDNTRNHPRVFLYTRVRFCRISACPHRFFQIFLLNICTVRNFDIPLQRQKERTTFLYVKNLRRGGRVVDCTGLENRRTERYRGFESLSLRLQRMESTENQLVPFLFYSLLPQIQVYFCFSIINSFAIIFMKRH